LAEVVASLAGADAVRPLDELSGALLLASSLVSRLRRQTRPSDADLAELDQATAQAIAVTRELRERWQASRAQGDYTSLSHVVREVAGHLQGVVPENAHLAVTCPTGPAVVAADRARLRGVVAEAVEVALTARPENPRLEVEMVLIEPAVASVDRAFAQLEVRWNASDPALDSRTEQRLRPAVHALGGTLQVRSSKRTGTALVLRFPRAF
jgi:hypothetical protein